MSSFLILKITLALSIAVTASITFGQSELQSMPDVKLQVKPGKLRMKSDAAVPLKNQIKGSGDTVIISNLPATEIFPENAVERSHFKKNLDGKGLAWVEYKGIARIVARDKARETLHSLREIAADPWCNFKRPGTVNMDFPEPTDINDVTRAFTLWTGQSTIVPQSIQGKIRIALDKPITLQRACRFWLAALAQLDFKSLSLKDVTVVLPITQLRSWKWPTLDSTNTFGPGVAFDFPELTEVATLSASYNQLTGRKIIVGADIKDRVRIIAPKAIASADLQLVFESALRSTGLSVDGDFVTRM